MDQRRHDVPAAFSNLLMPNTGTTPYHTAPRRDEDTGHYGSPSSPGPRVPAYALAQLDTSGSPRSSPTHSRASAGSGSTPRTTGLTLKPIQRVPPSPIAFSDPNTNNNTNAQHSIQYTMQTSDSNSYAALLKKLKAKERVAPLNRSDLDDPVSARGPLRNGQQQSQNPQQTNTPTPPSVGRYRSPSLQQRRRSVPDNVARGGALRMNEASPTPNRRLSQPRVLVRPPPGPARLAAAGYGSDGGYGSDRSRVGGETPPLSAAEGAQQKRKGRIKVVVRKRPVPTGEEDVVEVDPPIIHVNAQKVRIDLSEYTEAYQYGFDDAFAENHNNAFVYKQCGMPLIDTVFEGGSASCFAYGQTGSGKTHTMLGTETDMGFYLLAAKDIFDRCTSDHKVSVSMFEIYCNSLFDLFNSRSVVIPREDSSKRVVICGLTWQDITSVSDLAYWIDRGSEQRRTGSTSANEYSSRSHAVMTISVRNERERVYGSLKLVDLAGSERAADTAAHDRQTRLEGAEINKSLLALKECIRGLDERKKHIPFRGSKLTEVLRDSFEGNSRTVMIAAVTPAATSVLHTLNTLRYAFRVKGLSIDQNVVPSKQRKSRVAPARSKSTDPAAPYSILAQPLPPLYLTPAAAAAANRDRSPSARIEREKEREERRMRKHRKTRSRTMDPSSGGSRSGSPLGSNDAILALQVKVGAEIAGLRQEMMGVITKKDEEISRLNQKNEDLEMKLERLLEHIASKETALEREQEHAYH